MKHNPLFLPLLFLLMLTLAGCADTTPAPQSAPELDVITLHTTPALAHWLPDVADCTVSLSGVGVYTNLLPRTDLDPGAADLTLRLGAAQATDPYTAVMGTEEIIPIAGREVPVPALSLESLQAIFSGAVTNWGDVPEVREAGLTLDQPILILTYPRGNELRQFFSDIYLERVPLSSQAQTLFTAEVLEAQLQENPTALSYALAGQVPTSAQVLPVTGMDPLAAQLYVLAVTPQEPEGSLRQLLLCLQESR